MSDNKSNQHLEGHVSALQLLLADWDPYTIRRAINLAFPDTFIVKVQNSAFEQVGLEVHLAEAMRAIKNLSGSLDGSSGLGAAAVKNLKPLIDQATHNIVAAQQRLGYKTK